MDRPIAWVRLFIRELRRRLVIRVAVVYGTTAFVVLQLAEILADPFGLGSWAIRLVTFLLVLGFPLAVGLAWVYNLTEEGVVRAGADLESEGKLGPGGKPLTSTWLIVGSGSGPSLVSVDSSSRSQAIEQRPWLLQQCGLGDTGKAGPPEAPSERRRSS